jgi:acetyl-CoA acetyltransferase
MYTNMSVMMKNLRDKIVVVGIGETEYLLKSNRSPRELVIEAVQNALEDAALTVKDIDGIAGGHSGAEVFSPSDLAYNLGIQYRFNGLMGEGSGCNTSSFHLAALAITSGMADVMLTYSTTTYGSIMRAFDALSENKTVEDISAGPPVSLKDSLEVPYGSNTPGIYYAQMANRYMYEYGLTKQELVRHLGDIAIFERHNAVLNGKGIKKTRLDFEEYLKSPMVADPLRRDDCYVLTDGACAWIMTSAERAKHFPHTPVYVTGMGYDLTPMGGDDGGTQNAGGYLYKPHEIASLNNALRMADLSRKDLDFAEIYDSYTIMLLMALESLGFCKKGEGGAFVKRGAISIDGDMPVNTHGGNLAHSCVHGAPHVIEAIRQLRGEAGACQVKDAKIGMVSAGIVWDNYVTIFKRG